jgi:hypothetical protein
MNEPDVKKLLMFIQAGDGRQLSDADLAYWTNELPPMLDLETALEAVREFRFRPEPEIAKFRWLDITALQVYVRRIVAKRNAAALAEAAKRALPSAPHVAVTARGLRQRDPATWDELVAHGRADGNADRAYTQARMNGAPEDEARAAGERAYHETFATIEAEKNSRQSPTGTTKDPAPLDYSTLGESA